MSWPSDIPPDLEKALAELDGWLASASDADRWNVIKEWLERHGVAAPDTLPGRGELPRAEGKWD